MGFAEDQAKHDSVQAAAASLDSPLEDSLGEIYDEAYEAGADSRDGEVAKLEERIKELEEEKVERDAETKEAPKHGD